MKTVLFPVLITLSLAASQAQVWKENLDRNIQRLGNNPFPGDQSLSNAEDREEGAEKQDQLLKDKLTPDELPPPPLPEPVNSGEAAPSAATDRDAAADAMRGATTSQLDAIFSTPSTQGQTTIRRPVRNPNEDPGPPPDTTKPDTPDPIDPKGNTDNLKLGYVASWVPFTPASARTSEDEFIDGISATVDPELDAFSWGGLTIGDRLVGQTVESLEDEYLDFAGSYDLIQGAPDFSLGTLGGPFEGQRVIPGGVETVVPNQPRPDFDADRVLTGTVETPSPLGLETERGSIAVAFAGTRSQILLDLERSTLGEPSLLTTLRFYDETGTPITLLDRDGNRFENGVVEVPEAQSSVALTTPDGESGVQAFTLETRELGGVGIDSITSNGSNDRQAEEDPNREGYAVRAEVAPGSLPALEHISYGQWGEAGDPLRPGEQNHWIAGQPTSAANVPQSGVASYRGGVLGTIHRVAPEIRVFPVQDAGIVDTLRADLSLSVDFMTGNIGGGFHNIDTGQLGLSLGDISVNGGPGSVNGNAYNAALNGDSGLYGAMNGTFFGPEAEETGGDWSFLRQNGNEVVRAAGIFGGTREAGDASGSTTASVPETPAVDGSPDEPDGAVVVVEDVPVEPPIEVESASAELEEESATIQAVERAPGTTRARVTGPEDLAALQFIGWGEWSVGPDDPIEPPTSFLVGRLTPAHAIPTSGRGTYVGPVRGAARTEGKTVPVSGTTRLEADFATGSIRGSFSELRRGDTGGRFAAGTNVQMRWARGANDIRGNLSGLGGTGGISGSFYGPAAEEIGGTWRLQTGRGPAAGVFGGAR